MPDLATFAVDDGFSYSVPDGMNVEIGSIVRVPLGGRRVRGWVTSLREGDPRQLKDVIGVSGSRPIFTAELLSTLRWAAVHYVSPLAPLLPRAGPPNLPKSGRVKLDPAPTTETRAASSLELAQLIEKGRRPPLTFLAGAGPWLDDAAALASAAVSGGRSIVICVPTAADCHRYADALQRLFGNRVVAGTSSAAAADRTRAWSQAAGSPGSVVVGTPEVALWPVADLAVAVVVEEGRRAMKSRQTPTLHVRELLRRRAAVERFGLVFAGHVPSLELLAAGAHYMSGSTRAWPLVELIDRGQEPPSSGLVADGTRAAVAGAIARNEPGFVFVSRRGYAPATRCTNCGELRRCTKCGSNPGRGGTCERCGHANGACPNCGASSFSPVGAAVGRVIEELKRGHGTAVSGAGQGGLIQVGTERDVPPAGSVALAIVIDADSMLLRPHYRAEEDTLRIVTRVASAVRRGRGHRCVVQTRMPDHRVMAALRHGNGEELTTEWLAERQADQLPPFGEIVAIEIGDGPPNADGDLRKALAGAVAVFGPAESGDRERWLLQAPDLRRHKIHLRELVQSWRDRGATVRVDADPLDV